MKSVTVSQSRCKLKYYIFASSVSLVLSFTVLYDKWCNECSFLVHIVELSVYFSQILLNRFSKKFATISFRIPLANVVENSIFGKCKSLTSVTVTMSFRKGSVRHYFRHLDDTWVCRDMETSSKETCYVLLLLFFFVLLEYMATTGIH